MGAEVLEQKQQLVHERGAAPRPLDDRRRQFRFDGRTPGGELDEHRSRILPGRRAGPGDHACGLHPGQHVRHAAAGHADRRAHIARSLRARRGQVGEHQRGGRAGQRRLVRRGDIFGRYATDVGGEQGDPSQQPASFDRQMDPGHVTGTLALVESCPRELDRRDGTAPGIGAGPFAGGRRTDRDVWPARRPAAPTATASSGLIVRRSWGGSRSRSRLCQGTGSRASVSAGVVL